MKNKKRRGFTLVELLIVLLILGVLVGLAVPRYMESQKAARARTFAANVRQIVSALEAYRMDTIGNGGSAHYPGTLSDLRTKHFTQEPINPYTGKSMLSSASADSGIQYQSDGTSYSICIAQQDVDDINNNGRTDEPLPITLYPACTGTLPFLPGSKYTVSAAPNNPSYGTVTGSGTYDYGSTATLTAAPNTGYKFVGWYEDGSQVSTATTYTFTVNDNRTLEARFESRYAIAFEDTFDSEASLSNWEVRIDFAPDLLPTLSIDNGTLKINTLEPLTLYVQSAIAIETPNPRHFVIEGDVKTNRKSAFPELWLGFRSINGQLLRFGFPYVYPNPPGDRFCIKGTDMDSCIQGDFKKDGDWMHLKVVVNDNVITGYVGTTPVLTATTNSVFMPGYVTVELWDNSFSDTTCWLDNITVYGY